MKTCSKGSIEAIVVAQVHNMNLKDNRKHRYNYNMKHMISQKDEKTVVTSARKIYMRMWFLSGLNGMIWEKGNNEKKQKNSHCLYTMKLLQREKRYIYIDRGRQRTEHMILWGTCLCHAVGCLQDKLSKANKWLWQSSMGCIMPQPCPSSDLVYRCLMRWLSL